MMQHYDATTNSMSLYVSQCNYASSSESISESNAFHVWISPAFCRCFTFATLMTLQNCKISASSDKAVQPTSEDMSTAHWAGPMHAFIALNCQLSTPTVPQCKVKKCTMCTDAQCTDACMCCPLYITSTTQSAKNNTHYPPVQHPEFKVMHANVALYITPTTHAPPASSSCRFLIWECEWIRCTFAVSLRFSRLCTMFKGTLKSVCFHDMMNSELKSTSTG